LILATVYLDKKSLDLTTYSRKYYRELEVLKRDINEASSLKVKGKKRILLKKNDDIKEYIFTSDLKLEIKENSRKRETYIDNIWGEFTNEDNLIFVKTKIKNERIDYVFFKK